MIAVGVLHTSALAQTPQNRPQTQTSPGPRQNEPAQLQREVNPTSDPRGRQDPERLAPSFRPVGIELGDFLLFPKIELDTAYNTNFFATDRNERATVLNVLRPEVQLRSRLPQHALTILGQLEAIYPWRYSDDARIDGLAEATGRYDLTDDASLTARFNMFSRHEDRGSEDDARGRKPTPTQGFTTELGGRIREGDFTFQVGSQLDRRTFENVSASNGRSIITNDRDRWEMSGFVRGSYEFIPSYAAVLQASVNRRTYDNARDQNGFERDSTGWRLEGGVGVEITNLLRGDFLVGWLQQDYRDPRLSDPSGPSVRAQLNWSPSRLTLVVPSIERSIVETTSANVSARVRTSTSLLVRHEYARNILLTGFLSANHDKFEGINRTAWTYEARGRMIYAMTPETYWGAELGYQARASELVDNDYKQTVFLLRLGFQM